MSMLSLLYVSTSLLDPAAADTGVAGIVAQSRPRNRLLDVTGALLFTGRHFAQMLEGPPPAIDALMASIRADRRHADVIVIAKQPIAARRFAAWALAYSGRSHFVARTVARSVTDSSRGSMRGTEALIRFMQDFSAGPSQQEPA
jgi:hypothetical protein